MVLSATLVRMDDLRDSIKINMTEEELIYFSMGPWDMEAEDGAESHLASAAEPSERSSNQASSSPK